MKFGRVWLISFLATPLLGNSSVAAFTLSGFPEDPSLVHAETSRTLFEDPEVLAPGEVGDGPTCTYRCPPRSKPKADLNCISSAKDCDCQDKYTMKHAKCVMLCDFQCPSNSNPYGINWCVQSFNDCVCSPSYYRHDGQCVKAPPGVPIPSPYDCGEFDMPSASPSRFCGYECPDHSSPIQQGKTCLQTIDDCQCEPLYKMQEEECIPTCQYQCPNNSAPIPDACVMTVDDCTCNAHYNKQGSKCVPSCDYNCPLHSMPSNSTSCIMSVNDCNCDLHYMKQGELCIPACDYQCPANSMPIDNSTCLMSINDCTCSKYHQKAGDKCIPSCDYKCPVNSVPVPGACLMSADDCSCLPHYAMQGGQCVPKCDFQCPTNASPLNGTSCVMSINDCACASNYNMTASGQCVPACNFKCPANSSPNSTCPMSLNDCKCASNYIMQNNSCILPPPPAPTPGGVPSSFRSTNQTITSVAYASGDPHFTTFDGFKFDCQAEGELIMVKSKTGNFQIQSRFTTVKNVTSRPSVVTGFVVKDDGYPLVQVSFARVSTSLTRILNTCPVNFFVNGNQRDFASGTGLANVLYKQSGSSGGSLKYTDTGVNVGFSVSVFAGTCFMSIEFRVPSSNDLYGLMGTPNGNPYDEWTLRDGTVIDLPSEATKYSQAPNYCSQTWCLTSPSQSFFTYEPGFRFADFAHCGKVFDPAQEDAIANAPADLVALCHGDEACIVDGLALGLGAAAAHLDNEDAIQNELEAVGSCPMFHLDFDSLGVGQYITSELADSYGFFISAVGGVARVFDTSNPGSSAYLGSPNSACPSGGPGIGAGGSPVNVASSNCDALGNVLIVQDTNTTFPAGSTNGGTISFDFIRPAFIGSIDILNVLEGKPVTVTVISENGGKTLLTAESSGENGVSHMTININHVQSLKVQFSGPGAVAFLDYFLCPCNFQCPANSKPATGDECIQSFADCDCILPYVKQGAQCVNSWDINGAFTIETTVRFDNLSAMKNQRVFDHGNGPNVDSVMMYQYDNTTDMAFVLYQNNKSYTARATNAIVQGSTDKWKVGVDGNGLMSIAKNGVRLVTFFGTVPKKIARKNQLIAKSQAGTVQQPTAVLGFTVTNFGQKYDDRWQSKPDQIHGSFSVDLYARFDKLANSWQRVFDFGNAAGKDNIMLTQNGAGGDISFHVFKSSKEYMVKAKNAIVEGVMTKWKCGVDSDGTMWIEKDGKRLVQGAGAVPDDVPRATQALAAAIDGQSRLSGVVLGLRVVNHNCDFQCPSNSAPLPFATCVQSFDDCICLPSYQKSSGKCVPLPCTYACPANSLPIAGKSCIRGFDDCVCAAPFYEAKNGMCAHRWEITGPAVITVTAQFNNPSSGKRQLLFDFGNGPNQDNISLGQCDTSYDMCFSITKGGLTYTVRAVGVINSGATDIWKAGVNAQGVMWIEKNNRRVIQGMGTVPANVVRQKKLVGMSSATGDAPLNGAVLGITVVNDGDIPGTQLANVPTQIYGAFAVEAYVQFDNLTASSSQRIFDFGNGQGLDQIYFSQVSNTSDLTFTYFYASGKTWGVTVPGGIDVGVLSKWKCSVTLDGAMSVEKDDNLVAMRQGVTPPPRVYRNFNSVGSMGYGSTSIDGAVFGLKVTNLVCNYACPANSSPIAGMSCIQTFNDCTCSDGYAKLGEQCVLKACAFQCPDYASPIVGKTCIQSATDCDCDLYYEKQGDQCVSSFAISGPVDVTVTARFDRILSYNSRQTLFEFSNVNGMDKVSLAQCDNTTDMCFTVGNSTVRAKAAIVKGSLDKWTALVDKTGLMSIIKNNKTLISGQGVVPANVTRNNVFLGLSSSIDDYPMEGLIQGAPLVTDLAIANAMPRSRWTNVADVQIYGSFAVETYARFDNLRLVSTQRLFHFYGDNNTDSISCAQYGNTNRMRLDLYVSAVNYTSITTNGGIEEGVWAKWRCGIHPNGTMFIEKNGVLLAKGQSPGSLMPRNVTRKNYVGVDAKATSNLFKGVVAGMRVTQPLTG